MLVFACADTFLAPMDNHLHNIDGCIFGEQHAETKKLILPYELKIMAKYMGGWPRMPILCTITLPSTTQG